ncbi:hypothetical protein NC652_024649 [Populus alba x Populus x berolinensis]|nr:hypothetical protein NC652_024649 [Populus alba x Populus x berolinensis]
MTESITVGFKIKINSQNSRRDKGSMYKSKESSQNQNKFAAPSESAAEATGTENQAGPNILDSNGEAMSSPGTIKVAQGVFKEQLRRASAVVETQDKTAPPLATHVLRPDNPTDPGNKPARLGILILNGQHVEQSGGSRGRCHGSVFLVVYEERLNLLEMLETNEKKMREMLGTKKNQIDEERVLS